MISILLEIHKFFYGHNNRYHYKYNNFLKWVVCNFMSKLCSLILFLYIKVKRFILGVPKPNGQINENIVISFTSYPDRINTLWMVVDSLFLQKMLPSRIVLYLSEENFPNKAAELPKSLLKYCGDLFKIVWVKDDLMPHKKYFYAFHEFKDKSIITVDDDNYYRNDLIITLWNIHLKYPDSVNANTVSTIADDRGKIGKYETWTSDIKEFNVSSFNFLAIGASGILYPVGEYRNSAVSSAENIKHLCLKADDLWLKCHELLFNVPVANGNYYCPAMTLWGSQKSSLISYNCSGKLSGNDEQWIALDKEYDINHKLQSLMGMQY